MALAACVSTQAPSQQAVRRIDPTYVAMYGARPDEPYPLPATDITEVDPRFLRREVAYYGREEPGTIVVDTTSRYLYLVREGGRAIRYGIGVGKEGLAWAGRARIGRKAAWPRWTPTASMIRREPERNARWAGGMEGGLSNPLGARALYLYNNGGDTMYRHPRHHGALVHRPIRVERLHPSVQPGHHRPLQPRPGRLAGGRAERAAPVRCRGRDAGIVHPLSALRWLSKGLAPSGQPFCFGGRSRFDVGLPSLLEARP